MSQFPPNLAIKFSSEGHSLFGSERISGAICSLMMTHVGACPAADDGGVYSKHNPILSDAI